MPRTKSQVLLNRTGLAPCSCGCGLTRPRVTQTIEFEHPSVKKEYDSNDRWLQQYDVDDPEVLKKCESDYQKDKRDYLQEKWRRSQEQAEIMSLMNMEPEERKNAAIMMDIQRNEHPIWTMGMTNAQIELVYAKFDLPKTEFFKAMCRFHQIPRPAVANMLMKMKKE